MGATVRPRSNGKWMVDIRGETIQGVRFRLRKVRGGTEAGARTWGLARERELTFGGGLQVEAEAEEPRDAVPTLEEFWPRYIDNHVKANRQKHSVLTLKQSIFRTHLRPAIGGKRLDEIGIEDVQALKRRLDGRSNKTVNNVLSTLGVVLKVAEEWGEVTKAIKVGLVKANPPEMRAYEDEELLRLEAASREVGWQAELVVLLGAHAGLRSGEMLALEWRDVDTKRGRIVVSRNVYRGVVGSPKGGRSRMVPMTDELAAALARRRGLSGGRVLGDAKPHTLRDWMERVQRIAGVINPGTKNGRLHVLRHTYGSRLAASGAPSISIKNLMGHASLKTTEGYVHSGKGSEEAAVALLKRGQPGDNGAVATLERKERAR